MQMVLDSQWGEKQDLSKYLSQFHKRFVHKSDIIFSSATSFGGSFLQSAADPDLSSRARTRDQAAHNYMFYGIIINSELRQNGLPAPLRGKEDHTAEISDNDFQCRLPSQYFSF